MLLIFTDMSINLFEPLPTLWDMSVIYLLMETEAIY